MSDETEKLRTDFEAWAKPEGFNLMRLVGENLSGLRDYDTYITEYAWRGWRADLAASASETKQGEREAVAEALLQWAADNYIEFRPDSNTPNTCLFCEVSLDEAEDEAEETHAPDCLHLRAKALRAQAPAGGEGLK